MVDEGIISVKVIPLGGEKVFLKADVEEDFNSLVKKSESFFNQWISTVRTWEPIDVAVARFIWFILYSIPIHAWK